MRSSPGAGASAAALNAEPALAGAVEEEDEGESAIEPAFERRGIVVEPACHGWRVDRFLAEIAAEFSRSHLQALVEGGYVQLDGRLVSRNSQRIAAGQRLDVELRPTAQSLAFRPQAMDLQAIYEDEEVLVIDKPAGLVVHPAAGNWSGTLLNGLLARYPQAAALPRAGIVHRLDKDTSGLMVVGKTLQAVTTLTRAIAHREVSRGYVALIHGALRGGSLEVEAPIGRHPIVRTRMAVTPAGRPAKTLVEPMVFAQGVTAVRCRLHTGRTHQIRVHLAHLGHPLVGDALYGGKPLLGLQRQALHACTLGFRKPQDGQWMELQCALPTDLRDAWQTVTGGA